jgi:hypothetical protein
MYTFLQESFTSCLQADTHATEQGLTVSVAKKKNEIILFVQTDNANARKCLKMPVDDEQSCDRLILYAMKDISKNELYCFLELKGKDLSHAVNQIINTHKYMLTLINNTIERRQHIFLKLCACICMHNSISAIREQQRQLEKLKKCLGTDKIKIKHGIKGPYDIGDFLRESYAS